MTLEELLQGNAGRWLMAAAMRDLARRRESGLRPPAYAKAVLQALDAATESADAASGTPVASVVVEAPGTWVTAAEGADRVGLRPRTVRAMRQSGAVRSRQIDGRTWQIDLDSLEAVAARRRESR